MPPLTIRKPETLISRLDQMEIQAVEKALDTLEKSKVIAKINGNTVEAVATPTVRNGAYFLFYLNGKRTAKAAVPQQLLPA